MGEGLVLALLFETEFPADFRNRGCAGGAQFVHNHGGGGVGEFEGFAKVGLGGKGRGDIGHHRVAGSNDINLAGYGQCAVVF